MKKMNREEYLQEAINFFSASFDKIGFSISDKKIRVGIGFPSSRGTTLSRRHIGECWHSKNSDDSTWELILSITISDTHQVLGTLLHELSHVATLGLKKKNGEIERSHGSLFRKCCYGVGLCGIPTQTTVGKSLKEIIDVFITLYGKYPHANLNANSKKHQTCRMVKVSCSCGYTIRVSRWWLQKGLPTCCCGEKMHIEESAKMRLAA